MKILLITKIYPQANCRMQHSTSVCHYFAREWVKSGHDVKVVFTYPIYSRLLHFIAIFFEKKIAKHYTALVTKERISEDKYYSLDRVDVYQVPLYKKYPRGKYSNKTVQLIADKIIKNNTKNDFIPNIIVGHFDYPTAGIIVKLKERYSVKTALILHGKTKLLKKAYKSIDQYPLNEIDLWGYRSLPIKNDFENSFQVSPKGFMCPSGVSDTFLANYEEKRFSDNLKGFIYVGSLVKRKHPITVLKALLNVYPKKDFHLEYIGEGAESSQLIKIKKKEKLENNVTLRGLIKREEIITHLKNAECFIMISSHEAFGLVYLEAMAMGCITIASRNEGMEGIIKHGENGFLCEAGNTEELSMLIKKINSLTSQEKDLISFNAHRTACEYTDKKISDTYISNLEKIYKD